MLEKVLTYIHNWFECSLRVDEWEIKDGCLDLPHVQDGQYFRIVGSVFNDGLHQQPVDDLVDETFIGGVYALAIPKAFLDLVEEIKEWDAKYGEGAASPYSSESFENYSYSKASASSAGGSSDPSNGWQREFRSRLIPYRKIS